MVADSLQILVLPDTSAPIDWTAGVTIGAFLESDASDSIAAVDTVVSYPSFLSLDGLRLIVPYGDGMGEPAERIFVHYDLPFWILIACVAVIAMLRFAFPRRMKQLVYSLGGERFLHTLIREGNLFEERISLGLILVFAATTGLLFKDLIDSYSSFSVPWAPDWLIWVLLNLAVLFWWSFRAVLIRFLGDIFGTQTATLTYLTRNLTFTLMQGIVLTLLLPFLYYGLWDWVLQTIIGILLLMHAYRIVLNIVSGISESGYGLGYQLLFVFSVEILPLLLLAKIILGFLT